jgi:AraC family transcriptional regulator
MSRLLGTPLPLAPWVLRCGSRVTQRWRRDGFEGVAPGMPGHSMATYYRGEQTCRWTMENDPLAGRLRSGTVTLIPESNDGQWSLGGPVDTSHVYLTSERLQACADQVASGRRVELVRRVGCEDAISARILKMLAHEARVADTSSMLFVEQATDLLCLQLLRRHATFPLRGPSVARGGLARWQTARVTDYMTEHLGREIRLAELAALLGLSRFHFCSAFRAATGRSPHAWLTAARMRRARELLADPEWPITRIALAVGFQSSSAFAASFRRVVGMSPSEYRRRL